jgi:hypothetical protein
MSYFLQRCLIFFPLFALCFQATQGKNDPERVKQILLRTTPAPIQLDGLIDEAWARADSTEDFFQLQPYFSKPPSRRTVAKVLTTDDALYCLMICYAPRDEIQVNTGLLDQNSGDIVSIMLDTFNDQQTAYKFSVTASGVRADCRLLDDARNRDYSWDGVWFSGARVYDWGFVTEIEIPYKSIKYDNALNEWGLDFDRFTPVNNEDLYWCNYERSEGQRISKFGKLILDDFRPGASGLNLEVYPVGFRRRRSSMRTGTTLSWTRGSISFTIPRNCSRSSLRQIPISPRSRRTRSNSTSRVMNHSSMNDDHSSRREMKFSWHREGSATAGSTVRSHSFIPGG